MTEATSENRKVLSIEQSRSILIFLYGVTITLLWLVLSGDTNTIRYAVTVGWFVIWLITTAVGISIGIMIFIGSDWRKIPLEERRGLAMGYLIMGFINSLTIFFHTARVDVLANLLSIPIAVFGLLLVYVYWRVYRMEDRKEEIFP